MEQTKINGKTRKKEQKQKQKKKIDNLQNDESHDEHQQQTPLRLQQSQVENQLNWWINSFFSIPAEWLGMHCLGCIVLYVWWFVEQK